MSEGSAKSTGLSFGSVLFFIFLIMKLTHYIDWSWWWVTAPLWLPITVLLGLAVIGFNIMVIAKVIKNF